MAATSAKMVPRVPIQKKRVPVEPAEMGSAVAYQELMRSAAGTALQASTVAAAPSLAAARVTV